MAFLNYAIFLFSEILLYNLLILKIYIQTCTPSKLIDKEFIEIKTDFKMFS